MPGMNKKLTSRIFFLSLINRAGVPDSRLQTDFKSLTNFSSETLILQTILYNLADLSIYGK
jgi:hypothetical protein